MTVDDKLTIRWPLNKCSLYHSTHGTCWHKQIVHFDTASSNDHWQTHIQRVYGIHCVRACKRSCVRACMCMCVSYMARIAAGLHDDQQHQHTAEGSLGQHLAI